MADIGINDGVQPMAILARFILIVCVLSNATSRSSAQDAATPDALSPLVERILAAWKSADVVCLGETHGRRLDSELRIALVRHPGFSQLVQVVVVEFANPAHQRLLDSFILEGEALSREELAVVWRDASGAEVWESPIYEQFLRAVRDINLQLPRAKRVRILGGDSEIDWRNISSAEQLVPLVNRGGNIRRIIAERVLDKELKALAVYGGRHCQKIGMGFPGELMRKYPGKFWSVYEFDAPQKGKELLGLGDKPAYIVVTGTRWESMPAAGLFITRRNETIGDMLDAVVFYGDMRDEVVSADLTELRAKYGPELARRRRLIDEALRMWSQRR